MGSDGSQVTERPRGAQAGGFWSNGRQRRKVLWLSGMAFLRRLGRSEASYASIRNVLFPPRPDFVKACEARTRLLIKILFLPARVPATLKLTVSLPDPLSLQGAYSPWPSCSTGFLDATTLQGPCP